MTKLASIFTIIFAFASIQDAYATNSDKAYGKAIQECKVKYKGDKAAIKQCKKQAKQTQKDNKKNTNKAQNQAKVKSKKDKTSKTYQDNKTGPTNDKKISRNSTQTKRTPERHDIAKKDLKATNVNLASASELANALPGIGKSKAQAIIEYRNTHGKFTKKEDLLNVPGIGKKTVAAMHSYLKF